MVNKFSNIKERVVQFIETQKLTKEFFFKKIGTTSANFRGDAKKTPLNSTVIANIFSLFPQINLEWLITGKGEMLKLEENKQTPDVNNCNEVAFAINKEDGYIKSLENNIKDLRNNIEDLRNNIEDLRKTIETKDVEINRLVAKLEMQKKDSN